jgi:alpha-amylase
MQLLAGLLSTLFNLVIVGGIGALLFLSAEEQWLEAALADAAADTAPAVSVAGGEMPRTVLVHLFEWRWDDIAAECEQRLGPAGFRAVQVSPPNEHRLVAGGPWWQRYQPVSYRLDSRSGDAEAFAAMVRRCAAAGVGIYVDAVINHMTGQRFADDPLWGTGSAGSGYDFQSYPDYRPEDFHQPYCESGSDTTERHKLQRCAASGRADLNTESDRVQNRIGDYLNGLLELGVAGFRIDAARHMGAGDIAGILARVRGAPYVYQAVIGGPGEAVQGKAYLGNGAVTEFDFGRRLADALRSGNLAVLEALLPSLGADGLLPSHKAVVFVDSHETQRGDGVDAAAAGRGLTHNDGALYDLANVFMLAWPYGTPRVMSSYRFADPSQGPPSDADGNTLPVHGAEGIGCGLGWLCEHRRPAILGMVGFRNACDGADLAHWWNDDSGARIAFGRGERGFVVINNSDEPMRQWLRTGLPAGRYCNVIASKVVAGRCEALPAATQALAAANSGPAIGKDADTQDAAAPEASAADVAPALEIDVRGDGSATIGVPARAAVAIHVQQRVDAASAR